MTGDIQSAEDFRLNSVILTSERLNRELNITNLVSEINIFESIQSLYLTGSITILDDQDAFNLIDLQGTERLEISVSQPSDDTDDPVIKNFVIVNIEKAVKTNDHSTIYSLYIIEDIGYLNNVKKISKAFDGIPESMIQKILERQISKNVFGYNVSTKTSETFQSSAQKLKRYIAPYVTPFTAIEDILERTTTRQGLPFFVHSTFTFDDIFIRDLETIIKTDAFNKDRPFIYSQSQTNNGADDTLAHAFSIAEMTSDMTDDTLFLAQVGAVGSLINTLSASYGEESSTPFNAYEFFDDLKSKNVIPQRYKFLIDREFIPDRSQNDNLKLQEHTSRIFRQISANVTTENEVNNLYAETNLIENELPVYAYIIREYLLKNMVTITVPGMHFLFKDPRRTVGNQIEIMTFKSDIPNASTELSDFQDKRRSGNFIILNKRHIFNCVDFKHNCVLQCGRIHQEEEAQ